MNTVSAIALSQHVRGDVNENMSDVEINLSSVGEVFDKWLEFNGIIGYGSEIRKVLLDIILSSNSGLELDVDQQKKLAELFGLELRELLT